MASVESPLFIVGSPRSGTTLLQVLIDYYSEIAIPPEGYVFRKFVGFSHCYGDLHTPRNLRILVRDLLQDERIKVWGLDIDVETFCRTLPAWEMRDIIAHLFSLYARAAGKRRWGDKTTLHAFYLHQITRFFPDARIIHLVRDGRDVAVSLRRAFLGPSSIVATAQRWSRYVIACDAFQQHARPGTFLKLSYEELVAHPEAVLRETLTFLGETPRVVGREVPRTPLTRTYLACSGIHRSLAQSISERSVGTYRRILSRREVALFEGVAGAALLRHGYLLDSREPGRPIVSERIRFAFQDHLIIRFLWKLIHPQARRELPLKIRERVERLIRRMRFGIRAICAGGRANLKPIRGPQRRTLCCYAASVILAAIAWTECSRYRQNTLAHHRWWRSTKATMGKPLWGAHPFLKTRVALSRNHLNLGAWYGYQEVLYQDAVAAQRVEFDFSLSPDAYLIFVFGKTPEGFSGIRLSRSPIFNDMYFTATPGGAFTQKIPLPPHPLKDGWNRFRITFHSGAFSVLLNGAPLLHQAVPVPREQVIGFRGSLQPALVDNVNIVPDGMTGVIREDFSSPVSCAITLCWAVAGILACQGIFVLVMRTLPTLRLAPRPLAVGSLRIPPHGRLWRCHGLCPWGSTRQHTLGRWLVTTNALIAVAGGSAFGWDFYVLSGRYPKVDQHQEALAAEKQADKVLEEIRRRYAGEHDPSVRRILFLGTSQTWGAGAPSDEATFVRLIEAKLNARADEPYRYECVNAGAWGVTSTKLLKSYKTELVAIMPILVVVDLSNNDGNVKTFASNLNAFVAENQSRGIHTLFVLEPNAREFAHSSLLANHEAMRRVAATHQVPVVDMHRYLAERYDDGLLWWDSVHLTAAGHGLFAERLSEEIVKGIQMLREPIGLSRSY